MQHGHPPSALIVVTDSCVRLPVTGLAPLAAVECAFARSALETRVLAATVKTRALSAREGDGAYRDRRGLGGGTGCHDRGAFKNPDGTGVIGLLLIKKGAGAGAYEHYHLGSGRATYGYQVNDAYAVHDQMLWLPIGLAYAF